MHNARLPGARSREKDIFFQFPCNNPPIFEKNTFYDVFVRVGGGYPVYIVGGSPVGWCGSKLMFVAWTVAERTFVLFTKNILLFSS